MAAELFGLSENPFKITPDLRFVHCGAGFQDVRRAVQGTVLAGQGVAVIVARPGMGKTMLLTLVAEELKRDRPGWTVALLNCGPDRRVEEFMADLGAAPAILLLDEAQNLTMETLRRLGQLADPSGTSDGTSPPFRIVLAGAPSLDALVAMDEMSALRRRIALYRRLDPLSEREVEAFMDDRLRTIGRHRADLFSDAAVASIVRYSSGVPRLINSLCATALFLAEFEGMRRVSAELVKEAAKNLKLAPADPAISHGAALDMSIPDALVIDGKAADGTATTGAIDPPPIRRNQLRIRQGLALAACAAAALALVAVRDGIVSDGRAVDQPMQASAPWHPTPPPALAGLWVDGVFESTSGEGSLDSRLNALLTRADAQVADLALTTPAGDNAFETYQEILTLMPGNGNALRGIYDLGGRYAELAETAAERGRRGTARIYYERGLALAPQHPALLALSGQSWVERTSRKRTNRGSRSASIDTTAPLSLTEPWTNRGGRR